MSTSKLLLTNLVGRRAVYRSATHTYDSVKKKVVEVESRTFKGEIVGLSDSRVVMLYDDGALRSHDINEITIEAAPLEPYR